MYFVNNLQTGNFNSFSDTNKAAETLKYKI